MTILELLNRMADGSGTRLKTFLLRVIESAPDLAPLAQQWLTLLEDALSVQSLVNLASALPGEIANIVKGNIDPRPHPDSRI